jgi:hypothetical protein
MSKYGDKVRRTQKPQVAPIGFRAVRLARNLPLLLTVLLKDTDASVAAKAAEKGADALLVRTNKVDVDALKALVEAAGEMPCGVLPDKLEREMVDDLKTAGIDFVVFDVEGTPACALLDHKLGYVLQLSAPKDDTTLRVIESLPLDALFLPEWKGPLTVEGQLELRRTVGLARKLLVLPVPLSIEAGELECLRDSGVASLLLGGGEKDVWDVLPSIRKMIEELPSPRRKEPTLEAILPRARAAAEEEEDDEEEDDEEE